MAEIRLGILGAGDVAHRHVEGLLRAGGVRLAGVAEPVEERRQSFQQAYGVRLAEADYRALLASSEIDTVLVLTPHFLHARMVLDALEAGKDVICEKPMAPTVGDCDRMIDSAHARGRKLFVTHSLREEFFFKTALRRLNAGALGKLLGASFCWYTDEAARLDTPGHWKGTTEKSGGGVLIDGGCHVADLANALLGRARRVHAFGGKLVARRAEVAEDTAVFSIEYETGALVSVFLGFTVGSSLRPTGGFAAGLSADLYGTEGHIDGGYVIRDADFRRWCVEHRPDEPDRHHYHDGRGRPGDIDLAIVRALEGKAPAPVTALDARNAVAVVQAAYESISSGRAVEVDWRGA
ncbi:MAG TPA: Gfo/Idh/MocA family oxidoreductase [Planctomycetota bacterium]|nr:Gfo/Idh/MocA family oxidoreductase [Planctomycetota bacterium]